MADKGRPTSYTLELGTKICAELSEGKSLRSVCAAEDMPSKTTIFRWLAPSNEATKDFRDQYAHAKEESADALVEDILDISDDGTNDYMTVTKGDKSYEVVNGEAIQRSRLRVDTRKWIASKLKPKKYGEKLDLTSGGDKIQRGMGLDEINAVLARADAEKAAEPPQG